MSRDIGNLDDAALLKRITPLPWEARYERTLWSRAGCLIAIASLVVCSAVCGRFLIDAMRVGGDIARQACLAISAIGLFACGSWIAVTIPRFRTRAAWRELLRRYGGAPLATYVREARVALKAGRCESVVLVRGRSAPISHMFLRRVYLGPTGDGVLEHRGTNWTSGPGSDTWFGCAGEAALDPVDGRLMRELVEIRSYATHRLEQCSIDDGLSLQLIVLRSDETVEKTDFNADGVAESCTHPGVLLARAILSYDVPTRR
jgi:hypothetical protein